MDSTSAGSGSHATPRFMESRPVWVAICGRQDLEGFRVWITSESTFGDIKGELVEMDPVNLEHASILCPHHGPRPYWTRSDPSSRPDDTCQMLYAVVNGESQHYILAVVRTSLVDYPIAIFDSDSNPTLTVVEAIVAAQPDLENRMPIVTEYSEAEVDIKLEPLEFDRRAATTRLSEYFPTAFFVTTVEAYSSALSVAPSSSIPPLLQTPLIHCEHLLRRVSHIPVFQAQATIVLQAVLHIIFIFSDALKPLFDETNPGIEAAFLSDGSLAELLPVAPELARQIANILDRMEQVIRALEATEMDREKAKSAINQTFVDLCGNFPGAVAVRQSYAIFSTLERLNNESSPQIQGNDPTSGPWIPTKEALHARERTLEAIRARLGDDHLDTARAMLSLASDYMTAGRYSKAENLQDKGVKVLKTRLGETHLDTLSSMLSLSLVYSARGHYRKAAPLQSLVLQGQKLQLGDKHVDVHRTKLYLGTTYFRQGRYPEAKQLQSIAVEDLRVALGVMHADTLTAMVELSMTYSILGLYSDAEKLQTMAIHSLVNALGESHISTYKAELTLASTHYRFGRYAEAKALQEKASDALTAKLGKTHPDTLLTNRDLSLTYSTVGEYGKAEEIQKKVLEGLKTGLGVSHPDTRIAELYLATTYYGKGKYPAANVLQTSALASLKAELGTEHMTVFAAMRDRALTRCAEGYQKEAIELQEVVWADLERILGAEHPETILAQRDLGATYKAKGDLHNAVSYQEKALQGIRKHLGVTHPETLITMLHLVIIYNNLGRPVDAQRLQEEAMASLEPEGLHHAGILSAIYELALSYKKLREGRLASKVEKVQKGPRSVGTHGYSLAELLAMLNAIEDKPDSDTDMDDGDPILSDNDDGLDVDMDKEV